MNHLLQNWRVIAPLVLIVGAFLFCPAMIYADADHLELPNDPMFDSYVSPDVLHHAITTGDTDAMIDAAKGLEKGEKELKRKRRGGSSDDMLRYAYKSAAIEKNRQAQEQLIAAAQAMEHAQLVNQFQNYNNQLPPIPPVPIPSLAFSPDPVQEALVNNMMRRAQRAYYFQTPSVLYMLQNLIATPYYPFSPEVKMEMNNYLDSMRRSTMESIEAYRNPSGGINRWYWGNEDTATANYRDNSTATNPTAWGPNNPNYGERPEGPADETLTPYEGKLLRAVFEYHPEGAKVLAIFPGSPLSAQVRVGDIITHLDNIPVESTWELENHYNWVIIDTIRGNNGREKTARIHVRPPTEKEEKESEHEGHSEK